jgi:hypothetical protein
MQAARLRDAEPALQKAAERAAAAASVTDKVGLNAAAEERKAKLRQQEVRCCQHHCMLQVILSSSFRYHSMHYALLFMRACLRLQKLLGKWHCLGDRVGTEAHAPRGTP